NTYVTAISADGRVIAGNSGAIGGGVSFTWSPSAGYNQFGSGPGIPGSNLVRGISADGSTVVGWGTINGQTILPYKYAGGVYTTLPFPSGYDSGSANGVSGDGSVIVGSMSTPSVFDHAMRWTSSTGMVDVGLARPGDISTSFTGISRDGSTAVGRSASGAT